MKQEVEYQNADKKKQTLWPLFYGWGSTASRLEPLQGGFLPSGIAESHLFLNIILRVSRMFLLFLNVIIISLSCFSCKHIAFCILWLFLCSKISSLDMFFFHDSLLSIKIPRYLAYSFCLNCSSWSIKISNLVWGWLPTLNNNKFDLDALKSRFIGFQPIDNIVYSNI